MPERRRLTILVYLEESKRPGMALVFVLPILISYEIGVQIMNLGRKEYTVNAADAILKRGLEEVGVYGALLSAVLIVVTLAMLHMQRKLSWRIRPATLAIMLPECLLVALPLFALQKLIAWTLLSGGAGRALGIGEKMILSLGAGVYEEYLFRMLLLGLFLWLGRRIVRNKESHSVYVGAVLLSAILFAGFHYLGSPADDPFGKNLHHYAFYTLAGVYFSWVYMSRGFGIAVGCHTAYDLMVVGMMAMPQAQ